MMSRSCSRRRPAFSLIELLMTITIIGILTALVISGISVSLAKARDTKAKNNANSIDQALAQYEVDNNKYVVATADGGVSIETIQSSLSPTYLRSTGAFTHTKAAKYISTQNADNYAQSWELESPTDATVTTGNGVYITNSAGTAGTVAAPGTSSTAIQFDGVDDYVNLPSGFSNFTGGMTVAFWYYPTSTAVWQRVIDLANGTANNNILVMRRANTQDLTFEVYSGFTSQGAVSATNAITQSTWQYFVVTLDASRNVSIYKNGVAQALNGGPATSVAISGMPPNILRTSNFIGRSNWAGDSYFQGVIDDLRIYNTNLSPTSITTLYNSGYGSYGAAGEASLANGWRFDEGTGTSATDYKGALTGTLTNGPVWVPGKAPLGLTGIGSSLTGHAFVVSRVR